MLNTFNLLCCSSSVDESRSISDKFLMSLYRSQGLCILVFYLLLDKTVSNISFSFFFFHDFNLISWRRNIWFTFPLLLYYLKNLQVRKEFKNVYMRLKTEDKTYGIQKPTQHFVRGIITLFTSLCLTHPLSLNETFHIHWFVLSRKHVLFFTCSSPLFDPLFKRSIHGLLYLYPFSFFSHSVIRPNLSPVRNIVFLWISTHALRSALRRIRAHPQAPPLGIRRKPLSFATLSIFFLSFNCSGIRKGDQQVPPLD